LRFDIAAWVTAGTLLFLTIYLHLLPALLAGLLVYELVHVIAERITARTGGKVAAVGLLATLIVGLLVAMMFGIVEFVRGDAGSLPRLLIKLAEIVEDSRDRLPAWILDYVPGDAETMKATAITWLREHAAELRLVGGDIGRVLVHVLIGMVIGAMVSLNEASHAVARGPLAAALAERARRLGDAFRNVVFAQVRISALNTFFTAIYLLAVLPLAGVHLPYAKTLVAITFLAGLLPVVGQPHLEYGDRDREPVAVGVGGARLARVPDRDPQARVLPQRAHRRRAHPGESVGDPARDAADGIGLRDRGPGRCADLLRLSQGRARGAQAPLGAGFLHAAPASFAWRSAWYDERTIGPHAAFANPIARASCSNMANSSGCA
jgi:hypothetical protein